MDSSILYRISRYWIFVLHPHHSVPEYWVHGVLPNLSRRLAWQVPERGRDSDRDRHQDAREAEDVLGRGAGTRRTATRISVTATSTRLAARWIGACLMVSRVCELCDPPPPPTLARFLDSANKQDGMWHVSCEEVVSWQGVEVRTLPPPPEHTRPAAAHITRRHDATRPRRSRFSQVDRPLVSAVQPVQR